MSGEKKQRYAPSMAVEGFMDDFVAYETLTPDGTADRLNALTEENERLREQIPRKAKIQELEAKLAEHKKRATHRMEQIETQAESIDALTRRVEELESALMHIRSFRDPTLKHAVKVAKRALTQRSERAER